MSKTIPLVAESASQTFRITLNGVSYSMTARWNVRASFWTLDISDEDDNAIILGVTLKTGSDLLAAYNFGIGGLYVYNASSTEEEMTIDNASADAYLVYFTPEENG